MSLFKTCSGCDHPWPDRDTFLRDADIQLIGYQIHFRSLGKGLFLFNHSCGTTLAIRVDIFQDLFEGTMIKTRATGTDKCPGFCLYQHELGECPTACECNYVRDIMQTIRFHPKDDRTAEPTASPGP